MDLKERDYLVDLESGRNVVFSEQDGISSNEEANELLSRAGSSFCNFDRSNRCIDRSTAVDEAVLFGNNFSHTLEGFTEDRDAIFSRRLDGEMKVGALEKKERPEKTKKKTLNKPPKPPRPPRSVSLDASDEKLVREMSELANLKRAKNERIDALKKKRRNARSASSSSSLWAMVVTILFCLIIVWQGRSGQDDPDPDPEPNAPLLSSILKEIL